MVSLFGTLPDWSQPSLGSPIIQLLFFPGNTEAVTGWEEEEERKGETNMPQEEGGTGRAQRPASPPISKPAER